MLTIGTFAHHSGLTVKALRFYDESGLLRPADTDPHSGHRRYAPEQLRSAILVKALRDLDMPLALVGEAMRAPDRLPELLARHEAETAAARDRAAQRAEAGRRLLAALDQPVRGETVDAPAERAVAVTVDVPDDEPDQDDEANQLLGELYAALAAQGVPVTGSLWTGMEPVGQDSVRVLLAWPVAPDAEVDVAALGIAGARVVDLPAGVEHRVSCPSPDEAGGQVAAAALFERVTPSDVAMFRQLVEVDHGGGPNRVTLAYRTPTSEPVGT